MDAEAKDLLAQVAEATAQIAQEMKLAREQQQQHFNAVQQQAAKTAGSQAELLAHISVTLEGIKSELSNIAAAG